MEDILVTFTFYNFDLGYCQGMNDLLSPILSIITDESDAFWCFVKLMERVESNFHKDQNGMHQQLMYLRLLCPTLDPTLYNYLASKQDMLNFYCCFRWMLIQFKREFDFENVMRLWEVIWSDHLTKHFHLFCAIGVLSTYTPTIIGQEMSFDDLIKVSFCM